MKHDEDTFYQMDFATLITMQIVMIRAYASGRSIGSAPSEGELPIFV
jgi:hypothetical protein